MKVNKQELLNNFDYTSNCSISHIFKGDKFLFAGKDVYTELYGKIIEVEEVVTENQTFKVAVDGEPQKLPFNITMFNNCILLRE